MFFIAHFSHIHIHTHKPKTKKKTNKKIEHFSACNFHLFLLPPGSPWCLWGRWGPGHWQSSSLCCHSGCPVPDAWLQKDTQRRGVKKVCFSSAHGKLTGRRELGRGDRFAEVDTAEMVSGEEAARREPPHIFLPQPEIHLRHSASSLSVWHKWQYLLTISTDFLLSLLSTCSKAHTRTRTHKHTLSFS